MAADYRRLHAKRLEPLEQGRGDTARAQDRHVASANGAALLGEPPVGANVHTQRAEGGNEQPEGQLGHRVTEGTLRTGPCDPGSVQAAFEEPVDPG